VKDIDFERRLFAGEIDLRIFPEDSLFWEEYPQFRHMKPRCVDSEDGEALI
jgi:hypothetical protein